MEASEEKQAPVILAIHPDELAFRAAFVRSFGGRGSARATVPVCIHLDHGSSLAQVMQAIQCGFTSVMIDAPTLPLEENIRICKEIVALAHAVDVSVEGELGTIGTTGPEAEAGTDVIIYTDPDDVVTFVDATASTVWRWRSVRRMGFIRKTKSLNWNWTCSKRSPLGWTSRWSCMAGPPTRRGDRRYVKLGVNKINISSDVKDAFYQKCREVLNDPVIRSQTPSIRPVSKP